MDPTASDDRDSILEAVAFTAALLHHPEQTDEAVHEVLGGIGNALGVSRDIFCNRDTAAGLVADLTGEWVADGVAAQIDEPALQGTPYAGGFDRWREQSRRLPLHGRIAEFPADEHEFLARSSPPRASTGPASAYPLFTAWWRNRRMHERARRRDDVHHLAPARGAGAGMILSRERPTP